MMNCTPSDASCYLKSPDTIGLKLTAIAIDYVSDKLTDNDGIQSKDWLLDHVSIITTTKSRTITSFKCSHDCCLSSDVISEESTQLFVRFSPKSGLQQQPQ